jgi:hypothetical protein
MKVSLLLHIQVSEILGVFAGVDLTPIHPFMCIQALHSSPSTISGHDWSSIAPGRQVLFNHGSSGRLRRRSLIHPLLGVVSTQLSSWLRAHSA